MIAHGTNGVIHFALLHLPAMFLPFSIIAQNDTDWKPRHYLTFEDAMRELQKLTKESWILP